MLKIFLLLLLLLRKTLIHTVSRWSFESDDPKK